MLRGRGSHTHTHTNITRGCNLMPPLPCAPLPIQDENCGAQSRVVVVTVCVSGRPNDSHARRRLEQDEREGVALPPRLAQCLGCRTHTQDNFTMPVCLSPPRETPGTYLATLLHAQATRTAKQPVRQQQTATARRPAEPKSWRWHCPATGDIQKVATFACQIHPQLRRPLRHLLQPA